MSTKSSQLKMFVLVRNDLDTTYRCVQGIHAVSAFYENGNDTNWHNETVVVLAVDNEDDLQHWCWKLDKAKKSWSGFNEPDLGGELTSISCIDTGEIFRKLPLAR